MKEFLATGAVLAFLTIFSVPSDEQCTEECFPEGVKQGVSDGFPAREGVTMPPASEAEETERWLPDFGSEAYL